MIDHGAIILALQEIGRDHGLEIPGDIKPGIINYFPDGNGKNKDGRCAYYPNDDGTFGYYFTNFKGVHEKGFHSPDGIQVPDANRQAMLEKIEADRKAERLKREELHKEAAKKAKRVWDQAQPADPNHPYLKRKQVKPYGIKQHEETLIVPVMDESGEIISLQRIQADGSKRFLSEGKTKGGFFILGEPDNSDIIYVGEGFATCATVYSAKGECVFVTFNSGNMTTVCQIIRKRYAEKKIIIAADNDLKTEKKTGVNPGKKAAEEASRAIGARVALCPVNSDFNDLYCSFDDPNKGFEKVDLALSNSQETSTIAGWEKPVLLGGAIAPEFPLDALPGILGEMARAVSEATETPIELAASLVLPVLGTACQGNFIVQVKTGHIEPLNIWVVVALDSGNRKSSVHSIITRPLSLWENSKRQELEPEIIEAASLRKNQESRLKSLRAKYGKAKQDELKDIEADILVIENNLVEIPLTPKVWAQDVTPEHLGTLLHNNNEKIAILSAEGGIFDIIGGRYSNGIPNLDLFLQAHSGDPVRVDRGSRESVYLSNPALTIGLSPQPTVLRSIADSPGFRGKGLLARFIYVLPESKLGYRRLECDPVPGSINDKYQELIFALLNTEKPEDEQGQKIPYILKLSNEAYQEHLEFALIVERELREGGRFEFLTDWAGKLPGAAARIAGLLHCAENPSQPWALNINVKTMQKALELASIFSQHALIAFDMMGADKSLEQARKIWRWVERGRFESFTKRDCFNALQGTFRKVVNMDDPLNILIERNYLQTITQETGGRPSVQYNVNPAFAKGWK